ncbi:HAMP domain-containing sensor histidine kinase [Phenylobacterium sp.]|uniref:HAMP domain-containing sensor histidine kinase n=1 Tax=Phenylobacterium sp. TaxID=1871053 RepID=UPI002732D126|nr:HAMP domain-containing sensor histidine kinase [Phenylobacterium sp.]MDP3660550.1 HAMP domain-containing sensor histidine kinase [Phenylobacterium sp.]
MIGGLRLRAWMWPTAMFAVAAAALAVGLIVVDRWGEAAIARQQTAVAASARDNFVAFAREEGPAALSTALNRKAREASPDGFRYALIGPRGEMLAGADVLSSLDAPDTGWRTVVEPDTQPKRRWRVLAAPLDGGRTLIVAEDLAARDALRRAILGGSAAALLITAAGAIAAGLGLHAILLRRTREMADAAQRIAEGDLSARVPARHDGDAFDDLARALNGMLMRIEELMTGMRTVTDSLAHDLRSPLTRLKGALSRASDPETAEAPRAAALEQAYREVESILATLSALLDIARAESGLSRTMMARVDVTELAQEMAELFGPAAEDAGQSLSVEGPQAHVVAVTHETLLRQAIGNLLYNAVVHAGDGAQVCLSVSEEQAGLIRVSVADTGRGVPAASLGRVQERFVRLDEHRSGPGTGLGLALVAACAKLHGGRLILEDNAPGLRAVMQLPSGSEALELSDASHYPLTPRTPAPAAGT